MCLVGHQYLLIRPCLYIPYTKKKRALLKERGSLFMDSDDNRQYYNIMVCIMWGREG